MERAVPVHLQVAVTGIDLPSASPTRRNPLSITVHAFGRP